MSAFEALKPWVAEQLGCAIEQLQWQPLLGDASFRRYVRCQLESESYIAAYAPPATEKNHEFVAVAKLLQAAQVNAPVVIAVDYQRGFILQTDLGQTDLQSVLNTQTVDHYYQQAMQQIAQMQSIQTDLLADYDESALALELSYFKAWFVEQLLGYQCSDAEDQLLNDFFEQVLAFCLAQPTAFVHRDYHCRNIMLTDQNELACIDFQDALIGPITYDLVSLIRDCYVVWPEQQVYQWAEQFRQRYYSNITQNDFVNYIDYMSLHRHIKVLGVFARLSVRDDKHRYLEDLPTVVNYVLQVAEKHPAATTFVTWFKQALLPLARQQAWGKNL